MSNPSKFQRATRQLGRLSLRLANDVKFRKGFEAIFFANRNRATKMRRYLRKNGFCYPFHIAFNRSPETPKVIISASVLDRSGNIGTTVGYTFQTLPL